MIEETYTCPKCGAPLDPERHDFSSAQPVRCVYCGSLFSNDDKTAQPETEYDAPYQHKIGSVLYKINTEYRKTKAAKPIESRSELLVEPGARLHFHMPSPLNKSDLRFRFGCLMILLVVLAALVGIYLLRNAHWGFLVGAVATALFWLLLVAATRDEQIDETLIIDGDGFHQTLKRRKKEKALHVPWSELRQVELTYQLQMVADAGTFKIGYNVEESERRLLFDSIERLALSLQPPT